MVNSQPNIVHEDTCVLTAGFKFWIQHQILGHLFERTETEEEEYILVKAYIADALNICKFPLDLYKIFPETVHNSFSYAVDVAADTHPAVSIDSDTVVNFRKTHERQTQLIRERLLLNMIT